MCCISYTIIILNSIKIKTKVTKKGIVENRLCFLLEQIISISLDSCSLLLPPHGTPCAFNELLSFDFSKNK